MPEQWRLLYSLNPMVGVIDGFRWCILSGQSQLYLPGLALSVLRRRLFSVARHQPVPRNGKEFCGPDLNSIADGHEMSDTVISVENLSKRYLWATSPRSGSAMPTLRDVIAREARNFARKAVDFFRGRQIVQGDEVEEFWALKNVSFEVKQGEVVGIIGRNGAGKSTLLKILSRITEPTEGRVVLRGRVGACSKLVQAFMEN